MSLRKISTVQLIVSLCLYLQAALGACPFKTHDPALESAINLFSTSKIGLLDVYVDIKAPASASTSS
jgi:hypothetical protein